MAERRRGGSGGSKDAEIRQLRRQLEQAEERADSLKQRLEREKGPIAVDASTAVAYDAASGTLTVGAHPAEQAFTGSPADLIALFDHAADAVEATAPAPEP